LTRRALLLGAAGVIFISAATPYCDLVMRGTWIGLTSLPISAVFLLTVAVLLNIPLRREGIGFTRAELLTLFCMTLGAAGIASFGLTGLLIPYMAGPFYFASPENHYTDALIQHLPAWMLAPGADNARWLYEGLPEGARIPWVPWLVPLAMWSILAGAVYLVFFCLSSLLRRPWADEEKLVFPLVQLPLEITRYDGKGGILPPLLRDPAFWIAFLIPFSLHTLNGLTRYLANMPSFNFHRIDIGQYLQGPVGGAVQPLWIRVLFSIIGLTYLLPSDVSFSLWVCYLFFLAQQAIAAHLGYTMTMVQAYPVREFVGQQMIGGILIFGGYLIWNARRHLLRAFRLALERPKPGEGADEPIPPHLAVRGAAFGLAVIVLWGTLAGAGAVRTLLLFMLFFLLQIVALRLVAQAGMLYIQHPYRPINLMLDAAGSSGVGASHVPSLVFFDHLWMLDNRSPLMPALLQSFRVAQAGEIPQRRMVWSMVLAIALAVPVSLASYLYLMYTNGGLKLNTWFTTYYTNNLYCRWATQLTTQGSNPHLIAILPMAIGGCTMFGLLSLYRAIYWWPIHPLGYLMGASWPMVNYWFSVFVGWALKILVLRYGGARFYRRCLPAALGLILGELFAGGLWVVVDFIIGMHDHEIFSF